MRDSDQATSPEATMARGTGAGANIWRSLPSTAALCLCLFLFALVPLDTDTGVVLRQDPQLGAELQIISERHPHDRGGVALALQVLIANRSEEHTSELHSHSNILFP